MPSIRIADLTIAHSRPLRVADQEGLEPPALGFGDRCSNHLSYWSAHAHNETLIAANRASAIPDYDL
jgi:hypothetical protein